MVLSVALITQVVAILSSIVAEFVPKWDGWAYKRQTLLVIAFLVPLAIWALVCLAALPLPVTGVECDTAGYIAVIGLGFAAMLSNQGTWHLYTRDKVAAKRR